MESFWSSCVVRLQERFDANLFDAFIAGARAEHDGNSRVSVIAPNPAAVRWLEQNTRAVVQQIACEIYGENTEVDFRIGKDEQPAAASSAPKSGRAKPARRATSLREDFTFKNFLPGHSNELALVAARVIAEGNADQISPLLFLFGRTGMGKTHLAQAIGNRYQALFPERRVRYLMARDFMTDVVNACRLDHVEKFRQRYNDLDLLIMDDIQYIGGENKERTQEEFFFIFNGMFDRKKIIVLTSDRAPAQIREFPNRITSRFIYGVPAQLTAPEQELREAILRQKAEQHGIMLDDNIIRFIAEKIKSNVRELEGALHRVLTNSRFLNKPPTLELCKDALADLITPNRESINVDLIKKKTAEFFRLRVADLSSKRRHRSIAYPRHIAVYLCRQMTNLSLPEIGEQFGSREHSTILHSCRKIEKEIKTNSKLEEDVRILEMLIKS